MKNNLVLPLTEISKDDVNTCGGKGASLGELIKIKMPVPNGFVVTTDVYKKFLQDNKIKIDLNSADTKNSKTPNLPSDKLQRLILRGDVSSTLQKEILVQFDKLKSKFVAVRSSATAEDATTTSWAGQLSTYLNTQKDDLIKNIECCWASLFSLRAINYRITQKLLKADIAVAVIVQKMIKADVSGIAFTAHPVTKNSGVVLIEAGFGLGEAMVSGIATPDHYSVDKNGLTICDFKIGKQKKMIIRVNNEQKTLDVPKKRQEKRKLPEKKAIELARLCIEIERHYGFPQDVEWALENGKFFILQSRPITTL
ncbi:MAG: PEP/pyruvate-binding domain-containing protein [Patescibacteria group bacterium]